MRLVILLLICSVSFSSCKENTEKKERMNIVEDHVELNNGKRWKANAETTIGIEKMISRMQSFSEKENSLGYNQLKDSLESDFTEIFQKCNMKGEAHNQLHNYLKPMVDLFEGLDSKELESNKKNFSKLDEHLLIYKNYFE